MQIISEFVNFILHLDVHLNAIIQNFGIWTYLILFLIIFMETGFVITPFLPGDSLIFAAGSFAGLGSLNLFALFITLSVAAILGDTINYWIGHFIGPRAFSGNIRFLKKEYLDRTHEFYERHGGKTIILARFIPIIRTFAPFVAGIGAMDYPRFFLFNVIGALMWVSLFLFGGYFFGNLQFVQDNFTIVIIVIILISVLPGVIEFLREKYRTHQEVEA
ncbi:MAG: DedA family protein [Anaerolineales bacterium]|jgi:membrane-associated protein